MKYVMVAKRNGKRPQHSQLVRFNTQVQENQNYPLNGERPIKFFDLFTLCVPHRQGIDITQHH